MIRRWQKTEGFSAVELLITLFIAAAFLGTGYQLYTVIIKDGGEARAQARASNIAYDNLRRYSPQATNPCSPVTPTPTATIPANSGLANASITVSMTCPYVNVAVTKVQVSVKYGSPQKEVVHAIYVTSN